MRAKIDVTTSTPEVFMQMRRWKYVLLIFALPLSCESSTAPAPSVSGVYVLENIGGSAPPKVIYSAEGYSETVLWSILDFDPAGHVILVERLRRTSPNTPPTELTQTMSYSYRVTDDGIVFELSEPCPPNALCMEPPTAAIVGSLLVLAYRGEPPFRPLSLYRLAAEGPGLPIE